MKKIYKNYFNISYIFPVNSFGIETSRDKFVIDIEKEVLKNRITTFLEKKISDEKISETFNLKDKPNWKLKKVRKILRNEYAGAHNSVPDIKRSMHKILYRPFDIQWIFYNDSVIERPCKAIMNHMIEENIALLTCKQQNKFGFSHVFVSDNISESHVVSTKIKEINHIFPLYFYRAKNNKGLFYFIDRKVPNINPRIFELLNVNMKLYGEVNSACTPEQIFYYIYAVLHSIIYRKKYANFLKNEFPCIPFTSNHAVFIKMGKLGQKLADIHLMKSNQLNKTFSRFEVPGNNAVKKVEYIPDVGVQNVEPLPEITRNKKTQLSGKVFINKTQYFSNIDKDTWNFQIGDHKTMHIWLKNRKGRTLTSEQIQHYIKIAQALKLTINCQNKIDKLYPKIEKDLIIQKDI